MTNRPSDFNAPHRGDPRSGKTPDFDQFEAVELYCGTCKRAVPVRKFLLLVLPEGDKYEYRCQYCGDTVGDKIDRTGQFYNLMKT